MDTQDRARVVAQAAAAKKAGDIVILDVGDIIGITDAFVIASAPSSRQVGTIVDEVERRLREVAAVKPRSVEGLDERTWVLMDYGDLVVQVFRDDLRAHYGLERLWSDAPRIAWGAAGVVRPDEGAAAG